MFEGEETAKKIIVEFFDYNCSYCKKAHKDLQRIIKNFSDVKVIYKNLPILSKQSKRLAKLSLLIAKDSNEKFKKFHNFLLEKKGLINNNDVDKFLVKLGFSLKKINENLDNKYINSQIEKDFQLAKELSLSELQHLLLKIILFLGIVVMTS